MRTMEEIKARCEIYPHFEGSKKEHWIWQGAVRKQGNGIPVCSAPDYNADPTGRKTSVMNVRRAIRYIVTGKQIQKGREGHGTCGDPMCVSPDCTRWWTRAEYSKWAERNGRLKGDVRKVLASRKRWAGRRKITPEVFNIIMNDPRSGPKLAPELGLHKTTIAWVRAGHFKGPTINPFSGLMPR